jgi:prevent-host-death family protein
MKFVSVRELRNRPGAVWEDLHEQDLVITVNGKPVGLLVPISDETLEDTLMALRRARALTAVSSMRRHAAQTGLDRMSAEEIEAEIQAARRDRPA